MDEREEEEGNVGKKEGSFGFGVRVGVWQAVVFTSRGKSKGILHSINAEHAHARHAISSSKLQKQKRKQEHQLTANACTSLLTCYECAPTYDSKKQTVDEKGEAIAYAQSTANEVK